MMTGITKNKSGLSKHQPLEAKAFGAYLRELRKRQKLNQADLAQRIEVTPGYYGFFEQGRQIPSLKVINRLARALNTDYLEIAMRAGYDEFEARKKEALQGKGAMESPHGEDEGGDQQVDVELGYTSHGEAADTTHAGSNAKVPGNETHGAGLDGQRLEWAMMCIAQDPTYKLAEQFTQGVLPVNIKALVIQLYQAQTGRQILTADESAALNQMLHG